jgi:predicted ATPase with chaperone activity
MLMSGPPGSSKTLIARSMPGILPCLTIEEALDVTRIYSVADQLSPDEPLVRQRFKGTGLHINADMGPGEIRQICPVDETSTNLLKAAMQQMQLSARAYHRILKLARTIADLGGAEGIQALHIAEAIQYRPRLRV